MPVQVSILSVGEVQLPVAPGVTRLLRSITYSADGAFPRIVYVEPDKDTPAERRRLIAEDLKKAKEETPEGLTIP